MKVYNDNLVEVPMSIPNIIDYARTFAARWKPYLDDDTCFRCDVYTFDEKLLIEFYPADNEDPFDVTPKGAPSQQIIDSIGIITDGSIVICKPNHKSKWTCDAARDDADQTLHRRIIETMPKDKESEQQLKELENE